MVDASSWNSKGIINKMPQAWSPSPGKMEKTSLFLSYYADKITTGYDRALKNIHIPRNEGLNNT